MGVYNSVVVSTGHDDRINSLINYLNNLSGISAESAEETFNEVDFTGALFSIDGTNIQGYFGYNSDTTVTYTWLKNGDIYLLSQRKRGSGTAGNLTIHSYIEDGCSLISLYDSHTDADGLEFVLVRTTNSSNLIGYKRFDSATFQDISGLTFENILDTARIAYSYTNMFPYEAPPGTLDFLAQSYFVNNGIRKYTSTVLKECSTVTILSTVSLPTPLNNHLAIGAHCIVPIDEGGNE